jgi:hypothetical protein
MAAWFGESGAGLRRPPSEDNPPVATPDVVKNFGLRDQQLRASSDYMISEEFAHRVAEPRRAPIPRLTTRRTHADALGLVCVIVTWSTTSTRRGLRGRAPIEA